MCADKHAYYSTLLPCCDGEYLLVAKLSGCLQLLEVLEISSNLKSLLEIWNFVDDPGKNYS